MRFEGKSVIVTGASSGIGRTTALRFSEEGASVLAVGRNEARLQEVVNTAAEKKWNTIVPCVCDVSCENDVKRAVNTALSVFGKIDILVNVAGIQINKYVCDTEWDDYSSMMDINVGGTFLFMREVLPLLEKQQYGAIVNTGSELAFVGFPKVAAYTATKGAILSFSRSVALDAIQHGVRVNCICPGCTDTPILWDGDETSLNEEKRKRWSADMPIGRLVTTDEIASGILFLASDEASAIVGQTLVIDGGFTIK